MLSTAKTGDHDLIVKEAEHNRYFDSTVIGTTPVRVTRHAVCPMLTVFRKQEVSDQLSTRKASMGRLIFEQWLKTPATPREEWTTLSPRRGN